MAVVGEWRNDTFAAPLCSPISFHPTMNSELIGVPFDCLCINTDQCTCQFATDIYNNRSSLIWNIYLDTPFYPDDGFHSFEYDHVDENANSFNIFWDSTTTPSVFFRVQFNYKLIAGYQCGMHFGLAGMPSTSFHLPGGTTSGPVATFFVCETELAAYTDPSQLAGGYWDDGTHNSYISSV